MSAKAKTGRTASEAAHEKTNMETRAEAPEQSPSYHYDTPTTQGEGEEALSRRTRSAYLFIEGT